jgi:hypothetical protein
MATRDGSSTSDFLIDDNGSIFLLIPQTVSARIWIADNIGRDNGFQPYYPTIAVEPRFVQTIIEGIQGDGLACELGGAS